MKLFLLVGIKGASHTFVIYICLGLPLGLYLMLYDEVRPTVRGPYLLDLESLEGCQFCELCMVISHYSQRVQDVLAAWPCFTSATWKNCFGHSTFHRINGYLIGHFTARRHGKSWMSSASINHNWPPVKLVASCSCFQFGSLCKFCPKYH